MNRWILLAGIALAVLLLGWSAEGRWAPIGVDEETSRAWTLDTLSGTVCMVEADTGQPLRRTQKLVMICTGD